MFGQPLSMYIIGLPPTSSITSGWPSWPRSVPLDCDHIICRLFDVAGVDVFQRAVAGQIQIARRGTPLIGVLEALELFRIRCGHRGTTGRYKRCDGVKHLDLTFCCEPFHLNSPAWGLSVSPLQWRTARTRVLILGACGKKRILLVVLPAKLPPSQCWLYLSGRKPVATSRSQVSDAPPWIGLRNSNAYAIRGKSRNKYCMRSVHLIKSKSYDPRDRARRLPRTRECATPVTVGRAIAPFVRL